MNKVQPIVSKLCGLMKFHLQWIRFIAHDIVNSVKLFIFYNIVFRQEKSFRTTLQASLHLLSYLTIKQMVEEQEDGVGNTELGTCL